jgi:uncharacterized protein (TIGR02271 family)
LSTLQKQDLLARRGGDLYDRDGDKLGRIEEIYLDNQTQAPEWALVNTGLFGTKSTFVPLREATTEGDTLRVPYEKAHVKDAPQAEPDGQLSQHEEAELYSHYGLEYSQARSDSGLPEGDADTGAGDSGGAPAVGEDTSGPTTDNAMTRSEEELRVGTSEQEAGRVRLRKYVVEDEVTQTVPVKREELRVEREPITDANADAATDGPAISEEEHELVLHEEQPVTEKRAVPKERIRLDKDTHIEDQQITDTLRKEHIDVDNQDHTGA